MSTFDALKPREADLTDEQLRRIAALMRSLSGNHFADNRLYLVRTRLNQRLLELGVPGSEYLAKLEGDPGERDYLISALTTHKTDWFREKASLDYCVNWMAERRASLTAPWLVWSAAVSTGEEAFSLAIMLEEAQVGDYRILGSDICKESIATATEGIYTLETVSSQVPFPLLRKYFLKGRQPGPRGQMLTKPVDELRRKLKFRSQNLTRVELPSDVRFQIILLRNVLIYFDPETAIQVIGQLTPFLEPRGLLVLGLSETLPPSPELASLYRRVSGSIYEKC